MTDISGVIVELRRLINHLEMLNANPDINGRQQVTNKVQDIKIAVTQLEIMVASYLD